MEQDLHGVVVLERGEVPGWLEAEEEEWEVPEPVQGQPENASVPSAARLWLTKPESPATTGNALNVAQKW